jgi:hypothetical protein
MRYLFKGYVVFLAKEKNRIAILERFVDKLRGHRALFNLINDKL